MKKTKILIVEDNYINSKLYKIYFESYDVEVVTASNGLEGVNTIRENSDIDLVFMNYAMPVMDGIESTSEIRKFNKNVPIIMTSAAINSANQLESKSLEVGCNDYLEVPFRLTQFIGITEQYLGYKLVKK